MARKRSEPKPKNTKPSGPPHEIDPASALGRTMERMRQLLKTDPDKSARQWVDKFLRILFEEVSSEREEEQRAVDFDRSIFFESDRGCVLVAAAIVDEELEAMFRDLFKSRSGATKQEMDFLLTQRPQPPLGSTSIKIRLAFALGLIDRNLEQSLAALQALRSKVAAHSRREMELTQDQVFGIIKNLSEEAKATLNEQVHSGVMAELSRGLWRPLSLERTIFAATVYILLELLERARRSLIGKAGDS